MAILRNNCRQIVFNVILVVIWRLYFVTGDDKSCTVLNTHQEGVCRPLAECKSVMMLFQRHRNYTICEFQGRREIVCCPTPKMTDHSKNKVIWAPKREYEKKCDDYKAAVYEKIFVGAFLPDGESKAVPIAKCSQSGIPFIVNGQNAKPREFPHMALLGYPTPNGPRFVCGGTLISPNFVLTAGHCTYSESGPIALIRLGELDINSTTDDADHQDFTVKRIITHQSYRFRTKKNDIALLEMDRNVVFSPYIRPLCLPSSDLADEKFIASGWGHTEFAGTSSSHLQAVVLDNFDIPECSESYPDQVLERTTQLCAGSKNDSRDTCQGDSGGPLQVPHHALYCMYTIVGITSYGQACGIVGVPGIYTRVYPFVDWIENIVWGTGAGQDLTVDNRRVPEENRPKKEDRLIFT